MQSNDDQSDPDVVKKPDEETDPVEGAAPPPPGFPIGEPITPHSPENDKQLKKTVIKDNGDGEREKRNRERPHPPGPRRDE